MTTINIDQEIISNSHIINDDSLQYLKKLPSNSVDLVVSSPPYNIGKEYEVRTSLSKYLNEMKPIIHELIRVLSPKGNIAWEVGNYIKDKEVYPLDMYYYPIFKNLGLQLRNRIIWHFGHGLHAKLRFSGRYETILWFSKTADYTFNLDPVRIPSKYPGKKNYKGAHKGELSGNPKGKNPEDVWDIVQEDWEKEIWDVVNVKSNHVEKTVHPAQFPIELVDRLVLALSNPGDTVLDPFGGVGSTLISAVKNGRYGISIDTSEEYTQVAKNRLRLLSEGKLPMRPMTRPIYKPRKDSVSKVPESWQGKGVYKDAD